jgi:hypothetical protein
MTESTEDKVNFSDAEVFYVAAEAEKLLKRLGKITLREQLAVIQILLQSFLINEIIEDNRLFLLEHVTNSIKLELEAAKEKGTCQT